MRKISIIAIFTLFSLLAIAGVAAIGSFSLWVLHAFAPYPDYDEMVALNRRREVRAAAGLLEPYVIPEEAQQITALANRYVFVQKEGAQGLVLLPRAINQVRAADVLRNEGWEVQRMGIFIRAYKETSGQGNVEREEATRKAVVQSLKDIYSYKRSGVPINPLALVRVRKNEPRLFEGPYAAITVIRSGMIHMRASKNTDSWYSIDLDYPEERENEDTDITWIATPVKTLEHVPGILVEEWQDRAIDKFKFTKKRPDLVHDIQEDSRRSIIVMETGTGGIGIGVNGPDLIEIKNLFSSYLREEYSYHNPIRKAFALPDGGLGYEYVPNEDGLEPRNDANNPNCEVYDDYNNQEDSAWICFTKSRIVMATSPDIAEKVLQKNMDTMHAGIDLGGIEEIGKYGFKAIEISGNGESVAVDISLN